MTPRAGKQRWTSRDRRAALPDIVGGRRETLPIDADHNEAVVGLVRTEEFNHLTGGGGTAAS
ncbi:MAG: hypothetical protein WDO18_10770 [Acidobacteriota bacterium]